MRKANYAERDALGKVVFYVLLWKKKGVTKDLFCDYWRNVHGPVCARLPGQYQYWQFHLDPERSFPWSAPEGIGLGAPRNALFDGIAELSFTSEQDRKDWFRAAAILMDDENNLFSKAVGYTTSPGFSRTFVDSIDQPAPNGSLDLLKCHLLLRQQPGTDTQAFRQFLMEVFAPSAAASSYLLKLRLHCFDAVEGTRPDAQGVSHFEPADQQYQAACEFAFVDSLQMEAFFRSEEYVQATKACSRYISQMVPLAEMGTYTFVYDGQMTLAGQRSANVARLITEVGASNQVCPKITELMLGGQKKKTGLSNYLHGVHHVGITVENMEQSLEFYIDVLGGKLAVGGQGFSGEMLHNTLFQAEDLEAWATGEDPKCIGVPNLRDGTQQALDVNFISFGNTVVELIYYRDAKSQANGAEPFARSHPTSTAFVISSHLSFHVREDMDLNILAQLLEEEAQNRGMKKVRCNRIIHVDTDQERLHVDLEYKAQKFWDASQNDALFGGFYGWALFYCKGPSGEQLEFNQVTRKIKGSFARAQKEYFQSSAPLLQTPAANSSDILTLLR